MSIVDPNIFDSNLSSDEVYNVVNTLPMDYFLFSQLTHYWSRLYGVRTGERNEQDWGTFTVNQCLRDSVWRTLRSVANDIEQYVGFDLSPRYYTKTIDWPFDSHIRLRPGIESVDIVPQWSDLAGYESIAVSPFVQLNAPVTALAPFIVSMDTHLVKNPNEVWLRRGSDNGAYTVDSNYIPVRNGTDWDVHLDNTPIPYNPVDQVNVQDTRYAYVEIPDPGADCEGTVYPVYSGTNQIIPQSFAIDDMGGGNLRYWLYIYTLVNPDFYNNTVNLISGEFYKLLPSISFKCFQEVEEKGILTITCNDTSCSCNACQTCGDGKRFQVGTQIIDSERGVVRFHIEGELVIVDDVETLTSNCQCLDKCDHCTYSLTFSYKTNPNSLSSRYSRFIPNLRRAILYRTAADLPLVDCGCYIDDKEKLGFIFSQQQSFGSTTTNPLTGDVRTSFAFGDRVGQKIYGEILSKSPVFKIGVMGAKNGL